MGISSIKKSNSCAVPSLKRSSGMSPSAVAKGLKSSASFGTRILPSKIGLRNVVLSNRTDIQPGYEHVDNVSFANNRGAGQMRGVGLAGAFGGAGLGGTLGGSMQNYQVNGMGGQNAWQIGMSVAQLGFGVLDKFGVLGSLNNAQNAASNQAGNVLDNAMSDLGGIGIGVVGSDVAGVIGSMTSAQDSVTLRTSISLAENQLAEMDAKSPDLQQAAYDAQAQLKDLGPAVKDATSAVTTAEQGVKTAEQGVEGEKTKRDSAKLAFEKAGTKYNEAASKHIEAHDKAVDAGIRFGEASQNRINANIALQTAKDTLNNTPAEIDGPDGTKIHNPAYDTAQQAVKDAEQELEKAKEKETEAKKTYDDAQKAEADALKAKNEAYNDKETNKAEADKANADWEKAQKKLDSAKEGVQSKKEDLAKAKEKQQQAQDNLDAANGAIEKFSAHSHSTEQLRNAIKQNKSRLTKMENAELKEYNKLGKKNEKAEQKNDKLWNGIDSSDGMSKKEMKKMDKITYNNKATQARDARGAQLQNPVMQTLLSREVPKIDSDGNEYRSVEFEGKTYYSKNNQIISEAEYQELT